MLDVRIETFLKLCDTKSYTRTAELLNITQPTVTQHIQYLEKKYNASLVSYSGRILTITEKGERLRIFALEMKANNEKIELDMKNDSITSSKIRFGSTLTIGEYVMPEKLSRYLQKKPDAEITMLVDNTKVLLEKLEEGIIDFAIVEGYFDKEKYGSRLLKMAKYVGVCAKGHLLAGRTVSFDELRSERLIIREEGSGTRDILENILHERNLNIGSFSHCMAIGNFNAIKELVIKKLGITFVYREVVQQELNQGSLVQLELDNFDIDREFNIVYLRDDVLLDAYAEFWNFII